MLQLSFRRFAVRGILRFDSVQFVFAKIQQAGSLVVLAAPGGCTLFVEEAGTANDQTEREAARRNHI